MSTVQLQTVEAAANNEQKHIPTVLVRSHDMHDNMDVHRRAVAATEHAYEMQLSPRDMCTSIKRAMENGEKTGKWHVIVGSQYGSQFEHEQGSFIMMYVGRLAVTVFKA